MELVFTIVGLAMLAALIIGCRGGISITVVLKNEEPKQQIAPEKKEEPDRQIALEELMKRDTNEATRSVDDAIEKLNNYLKGG